VRNLGIDIANGAFLYFLDGDDWLNPTCIERMVAMQKQENCDIVVTDHMRFRMEDNKFLIHVTDDYYTKTYSVKDWFEATENTLELFTSSCGKLYKKDIFRNLRYPYGLKMEDNYTSYLAYLLANKISYTNEPLYIYRITPTGITSTASSTEKFPLKPLEEEITLLSMLGMNSDIAKNRYFWRLNKLENDYSSNAIPSYEYYKVRTFGEILKKHRYAE
jgi:glycosyltransferase involved in cell wall biosynthesis